MKQKANEMIQDLATKSVRKDMLLELTDKQYSNLTLMALRAGLHNAKELIQSFVADLTGWQRNGSDESQFANTWYDRAYCITTDFLMPWRYYVYNYDHDIEQLTEEPDSLKKAYANGAEWSRRVGTRYLGSIRSFCRRRKRIRNSSCSISKRKRQK